MRIQQDFVVKAGGSNPDPSVYCPARGYYDPAAEIPYTGDPAIPEIVPDDGSIVLLMTNAWDNGFNITVANSIPINKIRYTVYGANDTVLYTVDQNSNIALFYQFPANGGIILNSGLQLFKVVIKVATLGTIATFKFTTKTGGYAPLGWPVLEAHIKCPSLINLDTAFLTQKYLKYVKFYGNHNALVGMSQTFMDCNNLIECQMGVEMNALLYLSQAFRGTSALEVLILPTALPLLQSIQLTFNGCGLKSSPPLPASLPEVTNANGAFQSMLRLMGTLTIPAMNKCTGVTYIASFNPLMKKVLFLGGVIPSNGAGISLFYSCPELTEVDMGNEPWGKSGVSWTLAYIFDNNTPNIKTFKFPPKIIGLESANAMLFGYGGHNYWITEINTVDWSESSINTIYPTMGALKRFDQPTLKVSYFALSGTGTRKNALEYLEIDWVNSVFSTTGVNISNCNFSAAELNRMFALLPVVVGRTFTCNGNPGYATCDKTIATAKGWTVN